MKHSVSVVIPNWNGLDEIENCLDSLKNQTLKHHVIVVDNGSVDGSTELIEKKYPHVQLFKLPKNRGFAGGVNVGIQESMRRNDEFVALFNNDAVADKDWLKNLRLGFGDSKAAIVTGKMLKTTAKTIDSTGEFMTTWGMPGPRGRGEKDEGQYDKVEEVFGASGGASMYRISLFKKIGLFDETFFAYFEDVDISFRARLAGYKIVYVPGAIVHHKIGATSSKLGSFVRYHSLKNFELLYYKNMPGRLFFKYFPLKNLQFLRMSAGALRDGEIWAVIKAWVMIVLLLPSTTLKHFKIQNDRVVQSKEIDKILLHQMPGRQP